MKDNRFHALETRANTTILKPKKLSNFRVMLTEKAHEFMSKLDELSHRNSQKFKSEPLHLVCGYCKRNKFFPCTEPRHMTKKTGLCPDQICARKYRELTGLVDEPLEVYPPYRS